MKNRVLKSAIGDHEIWFDRDRDLYIVTEIGRAETIWAFTRLLAAQAWALGESQKRSASGDGR